MTTLRKEYSLQYREANYNVILQEFELSNCVKVLVFGSNNSCDRELEELVPERPADRMKMSTFSLFFCGLTVHFSCMGATQMFLLFL